MQKATNIVNKRRYLGVILGSIFMGATGIAISMALPLTSCSGTKEGIQYQAIDANSCKVSGVTSNFKIKDLVIPDSVKLDGTMHKVTVIGDHAFKLVNITGTLTLPHTLISIEDSAFFGCLNMTGALHLPQGLQTIDRDAFWGCEKLSGSLSIPDSVTTIRNSTFRECQHLTSLKCSSETTTIEDSAFYDCSALQTADLGNVTSIGPSAFQFCSELTSWKTEGVLAKVDDAAFRGCRKLNEIKFTNWTGNFNETGIQAFYDCKSGGTVAGTNAHSFIAQAKDHASLGNWTVAP